MLFIKNYQQENLGKAHPGYRLEPSQHSLQLAWNVRGVKQLWSERGPSAPCLFSSINSLKEGSNLQGMFCQLKAYILRTVLFSKCNDINATFVMNSFLSKITGDIIYDRPLLSFGYYVKFFSISSLWLSLHSGNQ